MDAPLRALPVLRAAVAASLWLCGAAATEEASQKRRGRRRKGRERGRAYREGGR